MQRASGHERLHRVPYGDGEIEFMLQPWFDIELGTSSDAHDIAIAGLAGADGADLAHAAHAVLAMRRLVRDGGALIVAARLEDGEGDLATIAPLLNDAIADRLVIVAASESPEIVRLAKLRAAVDVEEALDLAYEHIGRPSRALVLLVRS